MKTKKDAQTNPQHTPSRAKHYSKWGSHHQLMCMYPRLIPRVEADGKHTVGTHERLTSHQRPHIASHTYRGHLE